MRMPIILVVMLSVAGCDISEPVAAIGPKGQVFKGSATASVANGGYFSVTNGQITCAGTYDDMSPSLTVSFPVTCSNGQKGLGTSVRDANGLTGSGTIRMDDGTDWRFVFGPAANAF